MTLHHGDCLDVMAGMDPESVDAIVTDPPYGLGFMGKAWDHGVAGEPFWAQMLRVAKPSAYLLAFGGTRTVHRMTCAIEDAGWVIRDMLVWAYASGFPKSKASLKPAWEPIVMARKPGPLRMLAIDACRLSVGGPTTTIDAWGNDGNLCGSCAEDAGSPARPGTSATRASTTPRRAELLPNEADASGGTSRAGTGCSDGTTEGSTATSSSIDGSGSQPTAPSPTGSSFTTSTATSSITELRTCASCGVPITLSTIEQAGGRWPANLVLTDPIFDGGVEGVVGGGETSSGSRTGQYAGSGSWSGEYGPVGRDIDGDSGTYSRFFLIPKADRDDREPIVGRTETRANVHPTVKPTDLMRHLVRLVTPTGGIVLDPFLGSGTTALAAEMEGFAWVGIEREAEYVAIAEARLNGVQRGLGLESA